MDHCTPIPIDRIRATLGGLDRHKVERHRQAFESGEDVMPIDVHALADGSFVVAGNGRHRLAGAIAAGWATILARIRTWLRALGLRTLPFEA